MTHKVLTVLPEAIKKYIRNQVKEISTSAGAGAYNTKYAFRRPGSKTKKVTYP